jgi:hypothetical protein
VGHHAGTYHHAVRRSLAGLLFGLAFGCLSLAVSGWMLQRTAFNPDRTADLAGVVLQDDGVRTEVTSRIVDATSSQLGLPREDVQRKVDLVTSIPLGQELLAEVLHDAHAHLIGEQQEPVQITGEQMVQITREEAALSLPPVTLPVPKVRSLEITGNVLRWLVPTTALAALVLVVLGFLTHPEKASVFRSLGYGMLLMAVLVAVLGYVVPRFVVPAVVDGVWEAVPQQLADDARPMLIGVELLLIGGGMALLVASGLNQRRRRYNAPVTTYRYTEDRRWSQ